MSRALRRHPVTQQKQGTQRAAMPSVSAPKRGQGAREPRTLSRMLRPRWAEDIIAELRKVTWPTREDTWYLTFVVVVVAAAFGLFLGGVDMFFNWAIERTIIP